uniref:GATA-type domain-containing protein n=1 Tax=Meloidogyne enterolobii TaxID=390850 RepID=A0A6V7VTW8_MELEN|nr:unnamed protein product [Meloidogyne enterolobii]
MIKIIGKFILYFIILFNTQLIGKKVSVEVQIKNDWEEKREFIYLKNVELKERFVLKTIEKSNNRYCSSNYNMEGFLRPYELDQNKNIFSVEINDRTYTPCFVLKERVVLEVANNEIILNFIQGFEKRLLKENIENYKNKLLSSYWTEINLIGYKIELLDKLKVEYPKELENTIIYIGNKISEINEGNLRNCFNCGVKHSEKWHKYLKEQFLCHVCSEYKRKFGKLRSREMWFKTKKRITQDRKCFICGATSTCRWYCHLEMKTIYVEHVTKNNIEQRLKQKLKKRIRSSKY